MSDHEENDSTLKCVKCSLEITDEEFKECKLCDKSKHDKCLSENEIRSYDEVITKNVCDSCLFFLANESLKKINKRKSISKNAKDSSESDDEGSDSENKSSSDDSDIEVSTQNVTQRRVVENPRVNTNDYLHKLSLKRLPIVNDDNLSWSVFYEAFKETKHLFSHNENVTRIQDAIHDEKVMKIGGKTLFNPKTYEICIKSINKRLKHNLKPLYKEASELESHVTIKSYQKAKIIEFIDKLRNFESLAQAYEEYSYSNNQKFLANVVNVLPTFLKVAWEKNQAKLEKKRKKVTLKKLIDTLTEFIPILELSIRNESFTNQSTTTRKEKDEKRRFEKPRLYHFESNKPKEYSTNPKCWFHKINNHPFNKCKSLWAMDGKAVTEIAKKNGICTYCGKEWLTHKNCPNNKLKCNIEGCSLPHHSIFCFKRKINHASNNSETHNNAQNANMNNNVQNQQRREPERPQNPTRQRNTQAAQPPVDEMQEIVQQLNNSHMYTNNFQAPPSTSSDTRFNRPCTNGINIVDNSNIPNSCNNNSTTSRSILSVIVVKLNKNKQVALLIDSGSTVSLIEESVADELEIKGPWLPIELHWSGGQKRFDNYSRVIKTEACGLNSNRAYNLYFRTVRDLLISPQRFVAREFYEKYPHLLPLNLHDYEEISGVIGIDNVFVFEQLKMYKPKDKDLTAPFGVRCPLGDYLFGSFFNLAKIYNQLNKDIKVVKNDNRYMTHNHELKETELKELEEMQNEIYQNASEAILNNSYVDDIVKYVDTIKEAQSLTIQMKRILNTGGFNLLKINSNSQQVLDEIQQKLTKEELSHAKLFSPEKNEKLLGYDIDFRNDTLAISLNLEKFPSEIISGHERPNKRQVLQVLMTLFDPIGFVQFVTSKMKILYHKLCQENYDWDQVLNEEHFSLWQKCLEWFKDICKINIPRLYCPHYSNASEIQLWAFGDSGKDIACGVIFFRFMNQQNEQIGYNLVLSKTFVTPLKQKRTIPELELNVALKICIMANDVVKMHTFKIDKFVYATDNAAVKEWITNDPKKPSIYVKNRVDKIQTFTDKESWIWLPNIFMVADYGTKISSIPDICFQNDWFQPRLFSMPEKNWPEFTANRYEIESQLNMHYLYAQNCENDECNDDDVFDPSNFNKYLSLINAYQYAFRFIYLARNERVMKRIIAMKMTLVNDRHNRPLKDEIKSLTNVYYERRTEIMSIFFMYKQSENLCFAKAQKKEFAKELRLLKSNKAIPIHNRIHRLSPFLDQNDLIRVTTRLALTQENVREYGYDRICPILLPKQHPLTSLIILKYHENNKHSLKSTVIANITQRFFIPHIKWTVNQTIKTKCLNCRIQVVKPQPPLMGELPAVRLAHHQPAFTNTIVDLAGPLTVNIYRNITDKRYIFVYSCLTTRAIHLELIERMDADSTLIALTNTINLRGAPKIIVSDNGLNFKGAKTVLESDENKWNKVLLEKGVISTPITWKFGPPRTPHAQGSVERMVGLTKTILKKIIDMSALHKKLFNDFTLRAILCEVIGILNSRPLTLVPIQGTNTEILTPNYFLIGRQSIQTIPCTVSNKKSYSESYDDLKVISNILWNHCITYYLPTILMREKWVDVKEPLKVGDIVMTVDTIVVNSWRIGKIIEVIIGSNNQARQYKVLLGKNNIIADIKNMSHKKLLEKYKNENYSIVIRGAQSVAKININAIKM